MKPTEISAYAQAARSGQYERVTGLRGKYDHVRVQWEDQSVRRMLRPYLEPLVDRRLAAGRDLHILDLGCGSGDGFETLTAMQRSDAPAAAATTELFPPDRLGRYTGVELNPTLLEQAQVRHCGLPAARFVQADLRCGLPPEVGDEAYDVYFASFGTLSHLGEADTVDVLADVARHAEDGALVVVDWLGRYAYEWLNLWDADTSREQWMDYRISYIYSEQERATREIDSFPLRLLAPAEARRAFAAAGARTGAGLMEKQLFDRSLFVGRHMETGDYNAHAQPLRTAVNRLHEPLCRTNLDDLLFELRLPQGFPRQAESLQRAQAAWNALVRFTAKALESRDRGARSPEIPETASEGLRQSLRRLRDAVDMMASVEADDARAQFVEPQLGLALRNTELDCQEGAGCGHGLVAVYEIRKG